MGKQQFPLSDFDLESGVKDITHQGKPSEQSKLEPSKSSEQQAPQDTSDTKIRWQHFTVICAVDIVDKIRAIAKTEGFSIREVIEKFLRDGIARYEQKYGAIAKRKKSINDIL